MNELEKIKSFKFKRPGSVSRRECYYTFEEFWNSSTNGDWMLVLAEELGVNKVDYTLAYTECVNLHIDIMNAMTIENLYNTLEKYKKGEVSKEELYFAAGWAYDTAVMVGSDLHDAYLKNKEAANICRKYLTEEVMEKIRKYE